MRRLTARFFRTETPDFVKFQRHRMDRTANPNIKCMGLG